MCVLMLALRGRKSAQRDAGAQRREVLIGDNLARQHEM